MEQGLPKKKTCAFCDKAISKNTASREDTVPKWLQAELEIATDSVEPTLTSPTGELLAQRIHPVDQLLTGGICRTCNNGWMSELETEAQPIIRSLINSDRALDSLKRSERQVLGRWAVKTAYVLDLGGLEPRVPVEHVRALYENAPHLPEQAHVFARLHPKTRPWYYFSGAWWKHAELTANARETVQKHSYKIALQFGDLIVVVAFWPLRNWGFRTDRRELYLVWPPTAVVKEYQHPQPQEISESDAACRWYAITISVVPHRGAQGFVRATSN